MATSPSTGNLQICSLDNNQLFLAYRGMRQKICESVEKMLDLFDVIKRIVRKLPIDTMFLDRHNRKEVHIVHL